MYKYPENWSERSMSLKVANRAAKLNEEGTVRRQASASGYWLPVFVSFQGSWWQRLIESKRSVYLPAMAILTVCISPFH
jgi:hypothetical protein